MKYLIYLLFILSLFLNTHVYAQLTISVSRNLDLYKPFTAQAKQYMKTNEKVVSSTWSAFAQISILKTSKWNWSAGVTYQKIHHQIYDRIVRYTFINHANQATDTFYYYDPTDLISTSHSLGIRNEVSYQIHQTNKFTGRLGISNEIYFLEFFKSEYEPFNEATNKYEVQIHSLFADTPKNFFLSSSNLSVFYRETWQVAPGFSLGGKINIGTNLYSDWDQFRKYLWVGVGLEMGFGKAGRLAKRE